MKIFGHNLKIFQAIPFKTFITCAIYLICLKSQK